MDDVRTRYWLEESSRATGSSRIREGHRKEDGLRVVIKLPRNRYPSATDLALIRHEFALLQRLEGAPVARALELVRCDNGIGLVLEHQGHTSFDKLLEEGALELTRFLRLAVLTAGALEAVHARGIIHKDIKPQHFFVGLDEQRVVLIDFGIAAAREHEEQSPDSLDNLEGTLAYISPEQTGRMNRALDHRSDLYSLGVTLYQLLTGVLPFSATDPLEIVHSHIARQPPLASSVRADVPDMLCRILARLLSKVAEQRYQTAKGLKADLTRCLEHYQDDREIPEFSLGADDHRAGLHIPQKLYGRAEQAASLRAAFERASAGQPELVVITGGSGIGKSALVHELHKELALGGSFVEGKFDQFTRSVPYSAVAQACAELVRLQLAAPRAQLERWKQNLLHALGSNAQVLIDIVPELALVLGAQPPAAQLGPSESQNRFERLFQRFVRQCASAQQPLVVFLDDLQWADAASVRLIALMLENPEQKHLLLIANYRDGELEASHPFAQYLEGASGRVPVLSIVLEPLGRDTVLELLADTLPCTLSPLDALADLLVRKTLGNPFFVSQFLRKLFDDGLLCFDAAEKAWRFDRAAIEASGVTDNVVDLVIGKLQRLRVGAQAVLKAAACIGHRFDAGHLATISGAGAAELCQGLWESVEQGFLVPLDPKYKLLAFHEGTQADAPWREVGYRFTHDRVQQAAYAMIAEAERAPLHLQIGRLLLSQHEPGEPPDDALFEVVGQLNRGRSRIDDPRERQRLAALDVRAAQRARSNHAHGAAVELADIALELLGADAWETHLALVQSAHLIKAECCCLAVRHAEALASIESIEAHCRDALSRVPARNLKTFLLINQGRLVEATAMSLESLRLLGVEMPDPEDKAAVGQAIGAEFGKYQAMLGGRSVESLEDIPPMTDPEKLLLLSTMAQAIPAAFQWNPELMVLIVLRAVQLPLEHGTGPMSAFFYEQYGIVHSVVTSDYATSYRFGELGIRLSARPECEAARAGVEFIFATFIAPWCRPLSESIEHHEKGIRAGHDNGDQMHAAYCHGLQCAYRLYAGESLEALNADLPRYVRAIPKIDLINAGFFEMCRRTIACLSGDTPQFGEFEDEARFEATLLPPVAAMYGAHKAMLRFLAGRPREALEAVEAFKPLPVLFYNAEYSFYRGLALFELARAQGASSAGELLAQARDIVALHASWAESCPANFSHRHALLQAELAAANAETERAMSLYERAISEAGAQGHTPIVALASELCGRFHWLAGRKKVAVSYLIDARYHYQRWGAAAKAREIDRAYPGLERAAAPLQSSLVTQHVGTRTHATALGTEKSLDLISAMRATQAIASELDLRRLIERVLRILVENAGAQRGLLVLHQAGSLVVSASISIDPDRVELELDEPLEGSGRLPVSIVQFVSRSKEPVVIDDVAAGTRFSRDGYFAEHAVRSLACMPLLHQGELSALLYLENDAASAVFNAARVERLQFLGSHAAVAIENAQLYGQVQAATLRLSEANDTLEQKVRERTAKLRERNEDMRRVLDNVTHGLVSIDLAGRLSTERSAVVERWFGRFVEGATFAEQMRSIDRGYAEWFAISLEMLVEGTMPKELALEQLPSRLQHGERHYACSYSLINAAGKLAGLLIVIEDVTRELERASEEAAQREQLVLCRELSQDRSGLNGFFEEGEMLTSELAREETDEDTARRLLHTLKGNAALVGFSVLSQACHLAEDALASGASRADALASVMGRWRALHETRDMMLGQRGQDGVEVPRAELQRLAEAVRAGASTAQIVSDLTRWQLEPVGRPLERLGAYARGLSERLGKGRVAVAASDGGLLAEPLLARPLWSVLVHLVRNAVDHGFESAEERSLAGKPEANTLTLAAKPKGEDLLLEISDDGRGIDWSRVRSAAERNGSCASTPAELSRALFSPNLSTRTEVTTTSGRGVGLAAVEAEVRAFGGTVSVRSEPGLGTSFSIAIPLESVGAVVSLPVESERRLRVSDRPGRLPARA